MASWGKHLFPVRGRPCGCSIRPLKSIPPRVRPRQLKSTNSINLFLFFFFQAIRLLRVSAELETRANLLRREALQSLTITLAGSDTKRLWDLLTAFFGADHTGDEEDP